MFSFDISPRGNIPSKAGEYNASKKIGMIVSGPQPGSMSSITYGKLTAPISERCRGLGCDAGGSKLLIRLLW